MTQIQLRPAVPDDAEMIFRWRNDPFIVARGSSQRTVQWNEHLKWFEEIMGGNQQTMFIVQKDGQPIGQVRFDRLNEEICTISVYLLQEFIGKGYGVEVIRCGCLEILRLWNIQKVIACVRSDNVGSRSAFIKAGFMENNEGRYCPNGHVELLFSPLSPVPHNRLTSGDSAGCER